MDADTNATDPGWSSTSIKTEQDTFEGKTKYECFVSDVLNDFDSRVRVVHKSAEENVKAYEAYCDELKHQLDQVKAERDQLQNKLAIIERQSRDVLDLFSAMTCLTVTVQKPSGSDLNAITYHCRMDDGQLAGHTFILKLALKSWEYTYDPTGSPVIHKQCLVDLSFTSELCFPDYMLSRFLTNLLNATYANTTS